VFGENRNSSQEALEILSRLQHMLVDCYEKWVVKHPKRIYSPSFQPPVLLQPASLVPSSFKPQPPASAASPIPQVNSDREWEMEREQSRDVEWEV